MALLDSLRQRPALVRVCDVVHWNLSWLEETGFACKPGSARGKGKSLAPSWAKAHEEVGNETWWAEKGHRRIRQQSREQRLAGDRQTLRTRLPTRQQTQESTHADQHARQC